MTVFGEGGDDFNIGRDGGIGGVNDAKRCLAAFYQCQGGAHIVGTCQPWFDGVPLTKAFKRLSGVNTGRDMVRIANGNAVLFIDQAGQIGLGRDGDRFKVTVGGAIRTSALARRSWRLLVAIRS